MIKYEAFKLLCNLIKEKWIFIRYLKIAKVATNYLCFIRKGHRLKQFSYKSIMSVMSGEESFAAWYKIIIIFKLI
jgi:hypothetical protein